MKGIISVQAGESLRDGWLNPPGLTVMKYSTTRVVSVPRSTTLLLLQYTVIITTSYCRREIFEKKVTAQILGVL